MSAKARSIQSGCDLLLLAHLGASDGAGVRGGEANDLLGCRGRLSRWRLRDGMCFSRSGRGLLRCAARFAIEPESEQDDDQSAAAADGAEQANSCEVVRTEDYGNGGHGGFGRDRGNGSLLSS